MVCVLCVSGDKSYEDVRTFLPSFPPFLLLSSLSPFLLFFSFFI